MTGIVILMFVSSAGVLWLAVAAKRHQDTAHNPAAPTCVRYARTIPPETKAAAHEAWADVREIEEIMGLDPTPEPADPHYRRPPWDKPRR